MPRQQRVERGCRVRRRRTATSDVLSARIGASQSVALSPRAPHRTGPAIRSPSARAQKHHAVAPLQQRLASRAAGRCRAAQHLPPASRGLLGRLDRRVLLGERDGAEPARAARAQAPRCVVERRPRRGSRCDRAKRASISASVIGAASRMRPCAARAGQLRPRRGTARAPAPRPDRHWRRGRSPAGTRRSRRGSWRCGPDRRARGSRRTRQIGPRSRRRRRRRRPSASPSAAHPRRGASGRGGNCRAGGRDRHRRRRARARSAPRRCRRRAARAFARRIDHHAGEPRRQRQTAQLAGLRR